MGLIEVDGETFEREVMTTDTPVVADFYADWCGPCKATAPTVRALARELVGQVRFVKVNIDRSPELAQRFDVRSIPTFIRFDAGEVSRRVVGASSAAGLTTGLALSRGPEGLEPATPRARRWWPRRRRTVRQSTPRS